MKVIYLTIIALLLFVEVRAQETSTTNPSVLALKKFLEQRTLPSAPMREQNIQGLVIVGIKIDSSQKIIAARYLKQSYEEYNYRVAEVLNKCNNPIMLPPGEYSIAFEFLIVPVRSKKNPIPYDPNGYPNFLFEVDIVYL